MQFSSKSSAFSTCHSLTASHPLLMAEIMWNANLGHVVLHFLVEKIHPDSKNHLNQTPKSPTIWRASPMAILTPLKLDRELHIHACNLSKRSKDAAWRKTLVEAKDEGDSYGQSQGRKPEGGFCKCYQQKILYANTMIYVKIRYLYTVNWKNFHIFYVHLRGKKTKGKFVNITLKEVWMHFMYHIYIYIYTKKHTSVTRIIPNPSNRSSSSKSSIWWRDWNCTSFVSVHWNCKGGFSENFKMVWKRATFIYLKLYISCFFSSRFLPATHQPF